MSLRMKSEEDTGPWTPPRTVGLESLYSIFSLFNACTYLFVCACMHVYMLTCRHTKAQTRRSEVSLQESILSFPFVDLGNATQATNLGGKLLSSLSCPTSWLLCGFEWARISLIGSLHRQWDTREPISKTGWKQQTKEFGFFFFFG